MPLFLGSFSTACELLFSSMGTIQNIPRTPQDDTAQFPNLVWRFLCPEGKFMHNDTKHCHLRPFIDPVFILKLPLTLSQYPSLDYGAI